MSLAPFLITTFKFTKSRVMKRLVASLIMLFTLGLGSAFGQANPKGSFVIDPYYGFPNWSRSIATTFIDDNGIDKSQFKAFGPTGLRAEYLLDDKFGIGFDVIVNGYSLSGTIQDTTYNAELDTTVIVERDAKYSMRRLRVQARFNYHFEVTNPNLDVYMGLGVGTNNRFRSYKVDGGDSEFNESGLKNFTLIPVSMRLAAGMRYYFNQNIGINTELGIGGPLVSAGLSVRF